MAEPGWYPDPSGTPQQRYWDGAQWTEHVAPMAAPQTAPPAQRSRGVGCLIAVVIGVVVLFVGAILAAIAIPTFLGAQERARDRSAQGDLRNALAAAKIVLADEGSYPETSQPLADVDRSLSFTDSAGPTEAGVVAYNREGGEIFLATRSEGGDCFYIADNGTATGFAADEACGPSRDQRYVANFPDAG
ncbi:MAG: DUF2510 domain-containing protein [Acidimicrobiia bacterium]